MVSTVLLCCIRFVSLSFCYHPTHFPYETLTPQMYCFICLHPMVLWRATNHYNIWCWFLLVFVFSFWALFFTPLGLITIPFENTPGLFHHSHFLLITIQPLLVNHIPQQRNIQIRSFLGLAPPPDPETPKYSHWPQSSLFSHPSESPLFFIQSLTFSLNDFLRLNETHFSYNKSPFTHITVALVTKLRE